MVSAAICVAEELDPGVLQCAVDAVAARHEVLRTRIITEADGLRQVVDAPQSNQIAVHDLRRHGDRARHRAEAIMAEDEESGFDLTRDPPLRVSLLTVTDDEQIISVVAHHIAFDAESFGVFWDELGVAYKAFVSDTHLDLDPLPFQYVDHAEWQREANANGEMDSDLAYWQQQLSGPQPAAALPTDRRLHNGRSGNGGSHYHRISAATWDRLSRIAGEHSATPFMVLATGLALALHRTTGADDIMFGMPVSERETPETEALIGMFVNTLPIRVAIDRDAGFTTVLEQVRDQVLGALNHRRVPFDLLVDVAAAKREAGRSPLFQVMCAIYAEDDEVAEFAGRPAIDVLEGGTDRSGAKYEVTVYGLPDPPTGATEISFEYNADLYTPEAISGFAEVIGALLTSAAEQPNQPVSRLEVVDQLTQTWLTETLNATVHPYPSDRTVSEVFADVAAVHGSRIAIKSAAGCLSYAELAAAASALTAQIQAQGVSQGDTVGLRIPRSPELVIAMLAVLQAGACYVPLDRSYPEDRLSYMAEDARLAATIRSGNGEYVITTTATSTPAFADPVPAYVMYTSGSTGLPKGVIVPHHAILRLVRNTDYVALAPGDVIAHTSNTSFDAATFEVWGALLNGATLAIVDGDSATSPTALAAVLPDLGVTTMFLTTALFNAIAREYPGAFASLDNLLFGGEAVDPAAVRRVLAARPPSRLLHVYGPTESTTFASWHEISDSETAAVTIPIGLPIANTTLHVLDRNRDIVPVGVIGEIYIGGDGLAVGYMGDSDLTAQRFVEHPRFGRLYRTGDLAKRDPAGNIEFIGRADRQVKLRGFRVEPGEIESHLRRDPRVTEALVRVWERPNDTRLIGYVVAANGEATEQAIKNRLGDRLPGYMVPSHIVTIESIPRNPNGKVDTEALPLPSDEGRAGYVPPPDARGQLLAAIWERVLGVARVGLTDNFFDLGGHSILAIELMAAVERETGVRIPLSVLFEAPTLAELADRVAATTTTRTLPQLVVPIHRGTSGDPLFCIHPGGGNVFVYEPLVRHLADEQPVFGIEASGVDGVGRPHRTIEEMAAEYVQIIERVQPVGPYHLLGYSLGGLIAFETAQQLRDRGAEVALLVLLDTYLPRDAGWWAEVRGALVELTGRGLAGTAEGLYDIWLSIREILGKIRHGTKWNWYRLRRRPIPPRLAGKQLTHIGLRAYRRYQPQPYDGSILFFRATGTDGAALDRPDITWSEVAAVETVDVLGEHTGPRSIVEDPYVAAVAVELERRVRGTS